MILRTIIMFIKQYKIYWKKNILMYQMNGNVNYLLMKMIIPKLCYKLEIDKFQTNNINMIQI